jgi:hypothetical protein
MTALRSCCARPTAFSVSLSADIQVQPTVNYSIELYRTVTDAVGELRVNLRTQNPSLKLYIMQFFKLCSGMRASN